MKCIECGNDIELIAESKEDRMYYHYKCSNCLLEWSQAEHVDDMSYCIQQNKILEQRVQTLEALVGSLDSTLKETNEKFELLLQRLGV